MVSIVMLYDGLCIITFKNPDGSLEPVSDKGDFIPDKRRSLPLKLYNDKKFAKKKVKMFIDHAMSYLEKWEREIPDKTLIEVVEEKYEKEMIHDVRYQIQKIMLSEDGTYIRDDAKSRAYRYFNVVNISSIFTMEYVNKYAPTQLIIFDEIKTMTLDEQVEEFGKRHKIVKTEVIERNRGLYDIQVEYVNENYTGEGPLKDKRCVIAYLTDDGELEPISDKGQFIFPDAKAQQYRIYRNPEMAMRKINMHVDHAWVYLDKYDQRMDKYAKKKEWAHGQRPRTLIDIITEKDECKLIDKSRFYLMKDMLDESMDHIREDAKEIAYKKVITIPIAPMLNLTEIEGNKGEDDRQDV